jgi:putative DNA primase/helicase
VASIQFNYYLKIIMTTQESQPSNSYISDKHLKEFRDSAIDDSIAKLNFYTLDVGDEEGANYLYEKLNIEIDHTNNGMPAGQYAQKLVNALMSGSWGFEGYKGVCAKLDSLLKLNGKEHRYLSVFGKGNQQLHIPKVSVKIGLKIAGKLNIKSEYIDRFDNLPSDRLVEDRGFWDWIISLDIPVTIIITEGTKKACSLISAGYLAVGLNGFNGWGTNVKGVEGIDKIDKYGSKLDDNGKVIKLIHADLQPLLKPNVEIVFALDRDENVPDHKEKTVRDVKNSKASFKKCVGKLVAKVTDTVWEGHKGVDDLIAAEGAEAFHKAYSSRLGKKVVSPTKGKQSKSESSENKPAAKASNFTSSIETGLVEIKFNDKGESTNIPIGNHLEAIARVNNPEGTDATLLLEFKTYYGSISRWSMSRGFLGGDSRDITSELLRLGYHYERGRKKELLEYLHSLGSQIEQDYTITDSSGWVQKSFVLPHKTHGDPDLRFRDVDPSPDVITEIKGDLQGWKDGVAKRCDGNSRLIMGLGCSFAAPLLPIVDIESGGFHLVGETSNGKTTILSVAASVTGVKAIPSWRTTDNALEGGLTAFNHLCMPLDELKQCEARAVGSVVYMLGNGIGKSRSTKNLTNRKSKTWLTIVLSSGELTIGDKMKECGQTIAGGQEVRLPDVPAIPKNSKYGCFETIHGAATAVQFVSTLEAAVKNHHGTALDAFLVKLVIDKADPQFASNLSKQVYLISAKLCEGTKDTAIARIAKRFALVQVAIGLAHKYGLLPFDIGQVDWAISTCFKDWLDARGGDGSIEIKNAIKRIELLLATNEFSDRIYHLADGDDNKVRNLLAYRKSVSGEYSETEEFWVLPSVFDDEFCKGVNKKELVKELQCIGLMVPPRTDGRPIHQRKINKKPGYYYVFYGNRQNDCEAREAREAHTSNLDK